MDEEAREDARTDGVDRAEPEEQDDERLTGSEYSAEDAILTATDDAAAEATDDVVPTAADVAASDEAQLPEETPVTDLGDTEGEAELAAIEESLAGPDASEAPTTYFPLVGAGEGAAGQEATDAPAAAVAPAPESAQEPVRGDFTSMAPNQVDLGPEGRSNMWVWIALVAGVLLAAGVAGYLWWHATSRPIPVPDVTGKLPAQATQVLNDAGLRLGNLSEETTDTAPVGTVIRQSPEALVELKPGATVSLVLAAPPETSKIPEVVGAVFDEAASTLANARLSVNRLDSYSSTAPAELVIGQLPGSGASLAPGEAVTLVVSKGSAPTSVRVPQLTGLPQVDAESLLSQLEVVAASYRSVAASVPAGVVVTQSPSPGTQVPAGGGVHYLVSDGGGTAAVVLPDVIGDARKAAESELKAKGLKVQVRFAASASVAKGNVISQMPPAGYRTGSGATVGLLVSTGPTAENAVPDLVAKPSAEASKAVTAAGFRPVLIEAPLSGETTPGTVIAQFPSAKTSWLRRLPVVCLIARGR